MKDKPLKNTESKDSEPEQQAPDLGDCIEDYLFLACIVIPVIIGVVRYLWIKFI